MGRIACPIPGHAEAWVELPPEWLGKHLLRRDAALRAAAPYQSQQIAVAAVSLAIADGWGGIPGVEGADPEKWDLAQTPIPLLRWLEETVWRDFAGAFVVPKNSSAPLPVGSTSPAARTNTAGS